jgi:hypothetical protein
MTKSSSQRTWVQSYNVGVSLDLKDAKIQTKNVVNLLVI